MPQMHSQRAFVSVVLMMFALTTVSYCQSTKSAQTRNVTAQPGGIKSSGKYWFNGKAYEFLLVREGPQIGNGMINKYDPPEGKTRTMVGYIMQGTPRPMGQEPLGDAALAYNAYISGVPTGQPSMTANTEVKQTGDTEVQQKEVQQTVKQTEKPDVKPTGEGYQVAFHGGDFGSDVVDFGKNKISITRPQGTTSLRWTGAAPAKTAQGHIWNTIRSGAAKTVTIAATSGNGGDVMSGWTMTGPDGETFNTAVSARGNQKTARTLDGAVDQCAREAFAALTAVKAIDGNFEVSGEQDLAKRAAGTH